MWCVVRFWKRTCMSVVPGTRFLHHQPFKVAVELRVLVQQSPQGQRRLAVVRIWFVEAGMGSGRRARSIEHGIKRVAHLRLKKVAYAAIRQSKSGSVGVTAAVIWASNADGMKARLFVPAHGRWVLRFAE